MRIWLTSDWHFGHPNIAGPKVSNWKEGARIFDSVEEMDYTLLDAINTQARQEDTIYMLGDFAMKDTLVPLYRRRIICQNIYFSPGNHDKRPYRHRSLFVDIKERFELNFMNQGEKTKMVMSHYAMRTWNKSHHGSMHVYGHSHGSLPDYGKSMDVGIDSAYKIFGQYRMFSLEEVAHILNRREIIYADHHKPKGAGNTRRYDDSEE